MGNELISFFHLYESVWLQLSWHVRYEYENGGLQATRILRGWKLFCYLGGNGSGELGREISSFSHQSLDFMRGAWDTRHQFHTVWRHHDIIFDTNLE